MKRTILITIVLLLTLPGIARAATMDELVTEYLLLELSMGQHDPAHVDAYFGTEELKERAVSEAATLEQIGERAEQLHTELDSIAAADPQEAERARMLALRLDALQMRNRLVRGDKPPFDEEAFALFNARPPSLDEAHFEAILQQIDALVPGEGSLAERVTEYREQFVIPHEKLDAVFRAAMDECRRRTLEKIELPEHERFTIEYVTDKPWGGYNWYKGDAYSVIQLNTDLPIQIDRAVDLGCHEGYPGHHTYNALLEKNLVREKGMREYSLYPLFSPQSLIAEGSANYGIEMAFPGNERKEFEKSVLFPLAGLDPALADDYYALEALRGKLSYARNEAARRYLNGEIDADEAREWVEKFTLSSPERAAKSLDFVDSYRSYVINYNYGKDLVADWVEAGDADSDLRWSRFIKLLSQPMAASDLE